MKVRPRKGPMHFWGNSASATHMQTLCGEWSDADNPLKWTTSKAHVRCKPCKRRLRQQEAEEL